MVGFMAAEDDIEVSLWRPFGARVVKDVLVADTADEIRASGIEYIVVGGLNLKLRHKTLEEWRNDTGAEIVATTTATIKVGEGEQDRKRRPHPPRAQDRDPLHRRLNQPLK